MTLSFAPDAIETWPLERLKPYARNAKTHGADQVARIAGRMAQFGWTVPLPRGGGRRTDRRPRPRPRRRRSSGCRKRR